MRLFVLSLPDSRQRRLSAIRLLQQSGIEFELVDGVEGAKMRPETLSVDPKAPQFMKPGEIGCYFGHLRILQRIVDYGLPYACVLEDEFCFEPNPDFGFQDIEAHLPQQFHYIHLQRNLSMNSKYKVVEQAGLFRRVRECEYGTISYIIERSLAQHILDQHSVCRMPIDHLFVELSRRGLFYEPQKPLVGVQLGLPSDIHH